jgi:PKD repeat protein/N-acetyl-anhydromuramyl-L-alanine amidase AmpD
MLTWFCFATYGQNERLIQNPYASYFSEAYQLYPTIPNGMLEAVAYTNTHFKHIGKSEPESCTGLPKAHGVMGLVLDGKGYFKNNLQRISIISGYSTKEIINDPRKNILAYAAALNELNELSIAPTLESYLQDITLLSELPDPTSTLANDFALSSQLYSICAFLNDPEFQIHYGFPNHQVKMEKIFGKENLKVLSSSHVLLSSNSISNKKGDQFSGGYMKSNEYGPAIWTPAPSCNYSSRSGTPVSAITIHTIQGSYAGAISWAQNCNSNVSYHYVIRSSDGQVTQMVLEANKAWHVGSENPYTIGYEHEGYVSDPSWYTTAMYNASSDLSRDVTNSGYGINPLRTYYGPSSSGTNTLGSCVKIKGHQHYPNQSHTDPGINWDWERYYKLINDNPAITTETTASGSYYDSGGAGNDYSDDERLLTLIAPTGATTVTLTFTAFDTELNWDYLYIYDGSTTDDPLIGTYTGTNSPGTVSATGGSILCEFRSDCSTLSSGWEATWISNANPQPIDSIPPVTTISTPASWVTTDFLATFTDTDNSSGVHERFYQAIDFDGSEWRANANNGFFSDNFDGAIHADWTTSTGTWGINNDLLEQTNESESNSNIYASLDQSMADAYLYHWSGKIEGSGGNKRAGFHFFSDDGSLPNRGNSYFVWFREDDNKIQIYKVVNDAFTLELDQPFTLSAAQWYDFKVTFNKTTGVIDVYLDNELSATWTDGSPYTTGNFISFRSGDCIYTVNNLKAYRSRTTSENILVGNAATNDLRYENIDPLTPAGRIKSIVTDSAGNISTIAAQDINVDWTAPSDVSLVNDGTGIDIDTTYSNTELSANWSLATDLNSDIARYWYAIGTSPGATDIINWTDNWFDDSITHTGLNLAYNITYYFSVQAENGAGILSNVVSSDGQYLDQPSATPVAGFNSSNTFICLNDSIDFINNSANATTYEWLFPGGNPATSAAVNPTVLYTTTGTYNIELIATGPGGIDTITQILSIDVSAPPVASFTASGNVLYLPNAFVGFTNTSTNANGYFWDFGDANTSNNTDPWHVYTAAGVYDVTMIAVNGVCPNDTSNISIHVFDATGVAEETSSFGLSVHPNPIDGQSNIYLELNKRERITFTLFDYTGKIAYQISEKTFAAGSHQISIAPAEGKLASGVYLLQLQTEEKVEHLKLMVK